MASRNDFSAKTRTALGLRSGFACAICKCGTVGPSQKSPYAVTNVGVAAHISAARPGGARYNPKLSTAARSGIENGIWLCQTHAKMIDDDAVTWTMERLLEVKQAREEVAYREIGIRVEHTTVGGGASNEVQEYGFAVVGELVPAYRAILGPMLADKVLTDKSELGVLMCGSPMADGSRIGGAPWTVFVQPDWLRWVLAGKSAKFTINGEVPPEHIYGKIPAWPDDFFEFLTALVKAKVTFAWRRSPHGYLALSQEPRRAV